MFPSCQHKRRKSELTEGDAAKTFLMGPGRENELGIFYILKIVIQAPCSSLQARQTSFSFGLSHPLSFCATSLSRWSIKFVASDCRLIFKGSPLALIVIPIPVKGWSPPRRSVCMHSLAGRVFVCLQQVDLCVGPGSGQEAKITQSSAWQTLGPRRRAVSAAVATFLCPAPSQLLPKLSAWFPATWPLLLAGFL